MSDHSELDLEEIQGGVDYEYSQHIAEQHEVRREDEKWADYLSREWEERTKLDGFKCEFAAQVRERSGPVYVYRPDSGGVLRLTIIHHPPAYHPEAVENGPRLP